MASKVISSVLRNGIFFGKSAIVTGGGTGIGKAITEELLYLGCNVLIASRKEERLQEAAKDIRAKLENYRTTADVPQLETLQCNIRKEDQVKLLIDTALSKFGRLDFLVNNGGGQFFSPAEDISLKGWNAVIDTNLTGAFLCSKEAYNKWMQNNGGVIVNMVANMFNGWPGMSHSGAARAAVENLTKSLAIEWAPSGVRINAIAPGSTIYSPTAVGNYGESQKFEAQIPRVPAKRLGRVEEVSGVVSFLLSPAAAFISGITVRIDAAQSLYTTSVPWEVPDHSNSPVYSWEEDDKDKKSSPISPGKSKL